MPSVRTGTVVAGVASLAMGLSCLWAAGESPATSPSTRVAQAAQPATQPAQATHTVKKGRLALDVDTEGMLQAVDPFEVRFKLKAYAGPLTITAVAPHGAQVKQGDLLIQCDPTDINWALESAESALATAEANLKKAELDNQLAVKTEALALRMTQDAVKQAEAGVKYWETMDGPQMLLNTSLMLKQVRHAVEDEEDELGQLKKMYQTEDLTKATADIVIKRAVRSAEQAKIRLQMQEDRSKKVTEFDYPIARQRVLDALEQANYQLAALKAAQAQGAVARKAAFTATRIAYEQSQRKLMELKNDAAALSVRAPQSGLVLYGNVVNGMWMGADPRLLALGENVAPGQVVMRLIAPAKLRCELSLSEAQAAWVTAGLKATVTPAAYPQRQIESVTDAVLAQPRSNPGPFGFITSITLRAVDLPLLPGMKAAVHIDAPQRPEALLVPLSAIDKGHVSFCGSDGKIERRPVTLGLSDGKQVEIRSGLAEGDKVLLTAKK